MNEDHAAVLWMIFGLCVIFGFIAVYLTPLARAFGS
jgi:hypothetical protein